MTESSVGADARIASSGELKIDCRKAARRGAFCVKGESSLEQPKVSPMGAAPKGWRKSIQSVRQD